MTDRERDELLELRGDIRRAVIAMIVAGATIMVSGLIGVGMTLGRIENVTATAARLETAAAQREVRVTELERQDYAARAERAAILRAVEALTARFESAAQREGRP